MTMRCMECNKTKFFYSAFLGRDTIKDEYGNESGEGLARYAEPRALWANISPATGYAQTEQFGTSLQYDRVIVMEQCPFDENAVLFIDSPPAKNADGEWLYDHIVKKIARSPSRGSVSVAVSKVKVS